MKYSFLISMLLSIQAYGQDSDLLGQDFDLEVLPALFETATTFEELEAAVNDSTSDVNNLDLDGDGEVDYVLIQEEVDGETHVAFLRVAMAEDEYQDVATIEMEKKSSTTASFQIVGDAALYGEDYILEPEGGLVDISDNSEEASPGGTGGPSPYLNIPIAAVRVTICVGAYRPGYRAFRSPYGSGRRPMGFRPWRRHSRSAFRKRSSKRHRNSFRRTSNRRSSSAHNMQKKSHKSSAKATSKKSSTAKQNNSKTSAPKNSQKSSATKNQQPKSNSQKKSGSQQKKGGKQQKPRR